MDTDRSNTLSEASTSIDPKGARLDLRGVSTTTMPVGEPVAREVMTTPAIACRDHAHFEEVAAVGVISERDIAYALGGPLIRLAVRKPVHSGPFLRNPRGANSGARLARDIMTTPPVVVHTETPLHALAEILVKDQINRIPVVRDGRLLGVVTRGDVLASLAGLTKKRGTEVDEQPIVVGELP
jgi:CBS domain-containing protein